MSRKHFSPLTLSPHVTAPSYLRDMPDPDLSSSFTLISFYRFRAVTHPAAAVAEMRALWKPFKAMERVYVAEEGINAQMAVPTTVLRHFEAASSMLDVLRDDDDDDRDDAASAGNVNGRSFFRVNCDSHEMTADEYYSQAPFKALHIRVRNQILVDGLETPLDWAQQDRRKREKKERELTDVDIEKEMDPLDWHHRLPSSSSSSSSSSVLSPLILDCRNKFESDVGRFDGAIPLNTSTFQDSWAALETLLRDEDKGREVMTYCTGGIR
jgi:predicted sulfurtransferase